MACAGVHRSQGVHISFVKSTTMDSWNDKELAMMAKGGNTRLKEFFKKYDLSSNFDRYSTKAAVYYRQNLNNEAEGQNDDKMVEPSVDIGQQKMEVVKTKTASEIMENNGKFCS